MIIEPCVAEILFPLMKKEHSLRDLEEATGINKGTLSRHIRGKFKTITDSTWEKLYKALHAHINEKAYGDIIMGAIKKQGLTITELARRTGINESVLADYENGVRDIVENDYNKLQEVLQVSFAIPFEILKKLNPENWTDDNRLKGLAEALTFHNLRKKTFTLACGISMRSLIAYEKGTREMSEDTKTYIANSLGISVSDLFYGLKSKPQPREFNVDKLDTEKRVKNLPGDVKHLLEIYYALNETEKLRLKKMIRSFKTEKC